MLGLSNKWNAGTAGKRANSRHKALAALALPLAAVLLTACVANGYMRDSGAGADSPDPMPAQSAAYEEGGQELAADEKDIARDDTPDPMPAQSGTYEEGGQELAADEKNIAYALIRILQRMMNYGNPEILETYSFEGATVSVEYVDGYIWKKPGSPNGELLTRPEGITCLAKVPSSLESQTGAFVFNLSRNSDGSYYIHAFGFYVVPSSSMEQWFGSMSEGSRRPPESIRSFEFYFPYRSVSNPPPSQSDRAEKDGQGLTADERHVAETLISVLHASMGDRFQEYPEIYSFEGATVRAEYVDGYIWHEPDRPNTVLLETSPEGITCLVKVPESLEHQPSSYVYLFGRNADGSYYYDYFNFLPNSTSSMEQFLLIEGEASNWPPESIHSFEFYFPPRQPAKQ